ENGSSNHRRVLIYSAHKIILRNIQTFLSHLVCNIRRRCKLPERCTGGLHLSEMNQNGQPIIAKILLIARDELRSRWRGILEAQPFQLEWAGSREEADDALEATPFYELLLIDSDMKGTSWRELLRWALESGKIGTTIVLARHGDHQLWAEVLQLGAHDLVS